MLLLGADAAEGPTVMRYILFMGLIGCGAVVDHAPIAATDASDETAPSCGQEGTGCAGDPSCCAGLVCHDVCLKEPDGGMCLSTGQSCYEHENDCCVGLKCLTSSQGYLECSL